MAAAHVQTSTVTVNSSSATVTKGMTWTSGNIGIVYLLTWTATTSKIIQDVRDDLGNRFTQVILQTGNADRQVALYVCPNLIGGAATVTATMSGVAGNNLIVCGEYSGVDGTSGAEVTNNSTGGSDQTPTFAMNPSTGGSIYIGFIHHLGADQAISVTSGTQRAERETFPSVSMADFVNVSGSQTFTWNLAGSAAFYDELGATFQPSTAYTRGSRPALPADDRYLEINFSASELTDIATDDGTRVSLTGNDTNPFLMFIFKDNANLNDNVTITWNGQASVAPSSSAVTLQMYNRVTTTWDTKASNSAAAADTDFDLIAIVSPLTNYKDGSNIIACRVYQNPTFSSSSSCSSSSSSCRSSSSSSSSCRSSSSSCRSSSSCSSSCRSSSSSCRSSSSSSSSRNPCWVAAEIFGGWYAPKTVDARYYVLNIAPDWFRKFYIKNGKAIAKFISNKPILKSIIKPLFEYFARKGNNKITRENISKSL